MAVRPVFIPGLDEKEGLVRTELVSFRWFPGMSVEQKRRSVASLHAETLKLPGMVRVLEVSSKSPVDLGVQLSAFNLPVGGACLPQAVTVECAFQGSKVFENGGPYLDILEMTSREAKRDERLQTSGRLVGFRYQGTAWGLEPKTAFYDWLYVNALHGRPGLIERLLDYSAFTDIEFNPARSVNCQAYSLALFLSLYKRGLLKNAMSSHDAFLEIITSFSGDGRNDAAGQMNLPI